MDNQTVQEKYLDVAGGLERVRGNTKIYLRMLQLFMQSPEFDSFEQKLAEQDYEKASEVAHAIKGMTGNLSMPALFEESTALMHQLREGPADEGTLARYREAFTETKLLVENKIKQMEAENA